MRSGTSSRARGRERRGARRSAIRLAALPLKRAGQELVVPYDTDEVTRLSSTSRQDRLAGRCRIDRWWLRDGDIDGPRPPKLAASSRRDDGMAAGSARSDRRNERLMVDGGERISGDTVRSTSGLPDACRCGCANHPTTIAGTAAAFCGSGARRGRRRERINPATDSRNAASTVLDCSMSPQQVDIPSRPACGPCHTTLGLIRSGSPATWCSVDRRRNRPPKKASASIWRCSLRRATPTLAIGAAPSATN